MLAVSKRYVISLHFFVNSDSKGPYDICSKGIAMFHCNVLALSVPDQKRLGKVLDVCSFLHLFSVTILFCLELW